MTIRNVLVAALIGTASLVASVMPSLAGVITQTQSHLMSSTNWTDNLMFNKFDPSFGTLTSVYIKLEGTVNGVIRIENMSPSATIATGSLTATMKIYRPGGNIPANLIMTIAPSYSTGPIALSGFDGMLNFAGTSGYTNASPFGADDDVFIAPPPVSDLALFTGLGTITLPVVTTGASAFTGSGNMITSASTKAAADVTVKYYYDEPNTVPEPGSLALLGSGLLGLGAAGRRRKAKASA